MERLVTSNLELGIIASGQLCKMLIQEASKCDIGSVSNGFGYWITLTSPVQWLPEKKD